MPLLDHFRPPLVEAIPWRSLASGWLTRIADQLCERVPSDYLVREFVKSPVDTGTDVRVAPEPDPGSPWRSAWQPGDPSTVVPALFPDRFEVQVLREFGGHHLVAVVALVGPGDKDNLITRRAFAAKVTSHLRLGVCVLVVDVVTHPAPGVHDEIAALMELKGRLPASGRDSTSAVTYRPVIRGDRPQIDVWVTPIAVGDPLPTMPLRLIADHFVPVELELTYAEACRRRRLV